MYFAKTIVEVSFVFSTLTLQLFKPKDILKQMPIFIPGNPESVLFEFIHFIMSLPLKGFYYCPFLCCPSI